MKRALVTGAAAGIGRALSEALLREGVSVVGIDRDPAANVPGVRFLLGDLGVAADLRRLTEDLSREEPFDLVVHNAGISAVGRFEDSDLAAQREVIAVNLTAPLLLTPALLRRGLVRDGGAVVFVSSLSHFVGYPGAAVYAATKDGLASYARSLSVAVARRNIHVLTVFPGPTRTEHARRHAPPGAREESRMPPAEVARAILRALSRHKRRLVPGFTNRLAARLGILAPRWMDRVMRRVILDRLPAPEPRVASAR